MSYLLWHREGDVRIASARRVLRAAEVPLLSDAQTLRERLDHLCGVQARHLAEAAAQARDEGRAAGLEEGRRLGAEQLAEQLAALADQAARDSERSRNQAGALALQVVRKLLGQFADDAVLVALADAATADLLPAQPLAIAVHPGRVDAVRQRLAGRAEPAQRIEVRGDASLAPDGCRLETGYGSVDVSLASQLARLAAAWGCPPTEAGR